MPQVEPTTSRLVDCRYVDELSLAPRLAGGAHSLKAVTERHHHSELACRLPNLAPSFQASKEVRALLAAKADPAEKAESDLTALHVAAESLPPQI